MDGVKVALGTRGMRWTLHDIAQKIGKSGEPWYICNIYAFYAAIFA